MTLFGHNSQEFGVLSSANLLPPPQLHSIRAKKMKNHKKNSKPRKVIKGMVETMQKAL